MTVEFLVGAQTNYSAIVRPLQWFVVILIFIFFLRVIRAVYVETRPGGKKKERQKAPKGGSLEILEPVELEGQRVEIELHQSLTLGRSGSCDYPMPNDPYASTIHARVTRDDIGLFVEDLSSTNGTYVNAERIVEPTRVGKGDIVQLGELIMEVSK
jgi:hypothetical protein